MHRFKPWRTLLLALVALAVAAFAVTGCGDSDDSRSATTTESNEPVTITFWHPGTIDVKWLTKVTRDYEAENPNVTVKLVQQPLNSFPTLLRTAIATKKGPDGFPAATGPLAFDYYRGMMPLTDYVSEDDKETLTGWDTVSTPDGTPYAVPWQAQGINFYYDKAYFKQAGLDPEAPPATWDELLTACDALKAEGITPIVAGWKDGYMAAWYISAFAIQYQDEAELSKKISDPNWEHESIRKGFQLMKDLYDRGCFGEDSESAALFPDATNNFKARKGAMTLSLSSIALNWSEFRPTKVGKHLGAFLPPLVPGSLWDEPKFNTAPNLALVVAKWSEHPQEMYDYYSYLASAKVQQDAWETLGAFPNRPDVTTETDDPVGAEIVEWVKTKEQYNDQMSWIRLNVQDKVLVKIVAPVITGQMSIDDALSQMQDEQERAAPLPTS